MVGMAAVVPLLWAASPSRLRSGLVVLAYYLGGSWVIPQASKVFFSYDWSLLLGIGMWLAAAVLNSAVWVLLWPAHRAKR